MPTFVAGAPPPTTHSWPTPLARPRVCRAPPHSHPHARGGTRRGTCHPRPAASRRMLTPRAPPDRRVPLPPSWLPPTLLPPPPPPPPPQAHAPRALDDRAPSVDRCDPAPRGGIVRVRPPARPPPAARFKPSPPQRVCRASGAPPRHRASSSSDGGGGGPDTKAPGPPSRRVGRPCGTGALTRRVMN